MAFVARRPVALTSSLQRMIRPACSPSPLGSRAFSQRPLVLSFGNSRSAGRQISKTVRRSYQQAQGPIYTSPPLQQGNMATRLLYGGAIFGGTLLAINLVFNRTTREDGGMPDYERKYLNSTFIHTGIGLTTIAAAARTLHTQGWSYRLMATSPWLIVGGGLAASIGSMLVCYNTDPDNTVQKYGSWTAFNLAQAAILSPLYFTAPQILARAGLYTVGMMGSIAFVGATAKQEQYLYLGAPLLAGAAIVALSGFAPLLLPATAVRGLAMSENIWLYGGLAVFGGFTLYDIQKILKHARMSQQGLMKGDTVNESISLELDFINIFVRMVQILGMNQRRKR